MTPEPRFTWSGECTIAYEVVGDGPIDLVYMPGWINNLELVWENPLLARFIRRLASFSRLIMIDRRGGGLSDRLSPEDLPPIEGLADDVNSVLDTVGSKRAVMFGTSDAGAIGAMWAATYPDRSAGLIIYGSSPTGVDPGEWGSNWDAEAWQKFLENIRTSYGTRKYAEESLAWVDPSLKDDRRMMTWWARFQRLSLTPRTHLALAQNYINLDVRSILSTISVPTLVLHRSGDVLEPVEAGRDYARRIPGAEFVEFPGIDHHPWAGDQDAVIDCIKRFIATIRRDEAAAERVLATVLFTDIVDSTAQSAAMGDVRWRALREQHERSVRAHLSRFRGREIKTLGDGFLAIFDGPARGVRCALAITAATRALGVQVRCGLHTGEIELDGTDISGIAVAIGARIGAVAEASEVLVSQTVKDLVVGSGLVFESRGARRLHGVPDEWHLYLAKSGV